MNAFIEILATITIWLLVPIPLALLAWWTSRDKRGSEGLRPLAVAAVLFAAYSLLQFAPRFGFFADLTWNWQNKLLAFVAGLLFIWLWRGLSWREVGLGAPVRGYLRPTLIASGFLLVLITLLSYLTFVSTRGGVGIPDLETFLYQLIVPGLDEELVYRGILLVLIDRAFAARRTLWGAQVGWGLVITSLLFGLVHGLFIEDGLIFDPAQIIGTGVVGFVFCWVRYRTGSIWPAVVLHNAFNALGEVIPWLLSLLLGT